MFIPYSKLLYTLAKLKLFALKINDLLLYFTFGYEVLKA